MNRAIVSVAAVTAYLVIYVSLLSLGVSLVLSFYMLLISPFLIIWMVFCVLTDACGYPELKKDEEWGYRDMSKKGSRYFLNVS